MKNIELTSSGPSSSRSSFSSKENSLLSFFINCSLVSLSSMRISGLNFGSGIDEVLGVSSVFIGHSFLTSYKVLMNASNDNEFIIHTMGLGFSSSNL